MLARTVVALLTLTCAGGCSVAAAAAGASGDVVRALGEVDQAVASSLLDGIGSGGHVEVGLAPPLEPTERTYLCWLGPDGGEEIWADDAPTAERVCVRYHGTRGLYERHCECEPLLAIRARR